VKKACALVNHEAGRLPGWKKDAIVRAADETISGKLDENYPLYVWQTGSGTQSNINVNEVISNRAIQLLGGELGSQSPVGPNDDVNMGQSSNDTFPTAMHIAAVYALDEQLLPKVAALCATIERKAKRWEGVVKIGRTHLEDAVPLTVGQEWYGWAGQIRAALADGVRPKAMYPARRVPSFILHGCRFGAPDRFRTCDFAFAGQRRGPTAACDIVNLVSRQRRKDWRSVRKGACVWIFRRREGAARQTLSPGDRADPGLASVRGPDWLGPNRRREGCIHVHQTYRYAVRSAGRRSPAQGSLVATPTLKGATAQKVASKLISAGFVKEVKAKASNPIWRRDEESGASYALKLTAAGAKAIAVDDAAKPEDAGEASDALANRDQAAICQSWTPRTLDPQKRWSLVLYARLLLAAARSWPALLRCSSAIMARPLRN
jgi:hypothetical protein